LKALELEISDFFDSRNVELSDQCRDKVTAIGIVPIVRKRTIVFIFVEAYTLGVLLDKP
jgi:hypothetical protein